MSGTVVRTTKRMLGRGHGGARESHHSISPSLCLSISLSLSLSLSLSPGRLHLPLRPRPDSDLESNPARFRLPLVCVVLGPDWSFSYFSASDYGASFDLGVTPG